MLNTTTLINPRRLALLILSLLAAVLTFAISAGSASAKIQVSSDPQTGVLVDADNANNDMRSIMSSSNSGFINVYRIFSNRFDLEFGPGCVQERAGNDSIAECRRQGDRSRFFLRGGNDELRLGGFPVNPSRFTDGVRVAGGDGNDDLFGAEGEDSVNGEDGKDKIGGGRNEDRLFGGSGDDEIFASDGVEDTVACGFGVNDVAHLDLKDVVTDGACNSIDRKPVDEGPTLRISAKRRKLGRARRVRVRFRCPRTAQQRCKGKASLKLAKRGSKSPRRVSYDVARGTSELVTLKLTRREARRVRRKRRRAVVRATENGVHGKITTVREITVRP